MGRPKIYSIDENYFKIIDTFEKAYILGFLYADGNVGLTNSCIRCSISKEDVEILSFIKREVQYSGPIRYSESSGHQYCHLAFNSSSIKKDLIDLGIIPNKTYKSCSLPKCPDHLFNCMMLGFFDGDGSIWRINSNHQNCSEYCVNFSNNENVLLEIKQWLLNNQITSCNIRFRRGIDNKNSCMLDVKGSVNIEKLFKLMYGDCKFSLSRKKSRFIDFMDHCQRITRKFKPDSKLEILRLYEQGISQCEIAKILKIPPSSVRGVVQRGRRDGLITKIG
jgi:hypothetical protein